MPAPIAVRAWVHQLVHVGEVVQAEEADGGQLLGPGEVAEVVAVVVSAGGQGQPTAIGSRLPSQPALRRSRRKRFAGSGDEGGAVAGEAGRDRAVEDVEAEGDAGEQVVDVADAEQVLGGLLGQQRRGQLEHAAHLLLVAPERAADRDPVDPGGGDGLRRLAPQILVDARPGRCRRPPAAPGRARRCHSRQRSSQRCVRSIDRAVYSRSAWYGVHSSKTRAMSDPSFACTSIETSGEMNSAFPSL